MTLVMSGSVAPSNDSASEDQTTEPSLNTIQESTSEPVIAAENTDPIMNSALLEYGASSSLSDSARAICRLCGDTEADSTRLVTFLDGNEVSCNMFDLGFVSENIEEGSNVCVDYRDMYFGSCCGTTFFDGSQISVEKCILCDESTLNLDAIVFFHGEELRCTDVASKLLEEDRINSGSAVCETSKRSYAAMCCSADSGTDSGETLLSTGFSSPASPETFTDYWSAESWKDSYSLLDHSSTTTKRFGSCMAVILCLLQMVV